MAAPARAPASKAGAGSVTYWGPENILIGEIETFDQGYGGISNLRDQGPRLPTRRGRAVAAGAPLSARDGDIGAGGFPEPQLNNPLAPAQTLDPEIDNIANQSLCNNNHQGRNNLQLTREEHLQEAQRFDEELREIETKNREALRLMKYTTRLANEAKRRKYSRVSQSPSLLST